MSKVIIGHVSVILFMPFTSEKQLSQCPESPHWELSTPISYWMKTVTIQKRQEMNVLEVYVGQGALLSWPGWPPKYQRLHHLWLFNLGEFFYMMLCFPSGRKKKKKGKKQAANCLHHFNYVISILEMFLSSFPGRKVKWPSYGSYFYHLTSFLSSPFNNHPL